jgi:hypothetical protein
MSNPGSLARPAAREMQIAPDDAERAARPGRRDTVVLPLAVDLRDVHKSFGPVQAVRRVALGVRLGGGRGSPRPQRRREDLHDRHDPGPVLPGCRCGRCRTIRATLPGADEAELRAIPRVDGVEVRGDTFLIHSGDTDTVARLLLNQTPGPRRGDHRTRWKRRSSP